MEVPVEITFEGMDTSDAVRARVEKEVDKLEQFQGRLTSCRVAVIAPRHHQNKGGLFEVHIYATLPGHADIVVDRNPPKDHAHEDVYVAIRDAFAAARRQLQDKSRKMQGKVKRHEETPRGKISKLFPPEDYGFIATPTGEEVYFHRNAVQSGDFDSLEIGTDVQFSREDGEKGPQASAVRVSGRMPS